MHRHGRFDGDQPGHHGRCDSPRRSRGITIRSAVIRDGVATVHAGAGVVADSIPAKEAAEVSAKAASMLAAIGAEVEA